MALSPQTTSFLDSRQVQALPQTWGGFNLAVLKVKQIHYERIEVYTIAI